MDEVCDETRFTKMVSGALDQLRNGLGDGLFTAYPGEHNWEIAHRVLMPGGLGFLDVRGIADYCSFWPSLDSIDVRRDARYCFSTCREMGQIWTEGEN